MAKATVAETEGKIVGIDLIENKAEAIKESFSDCKFIEQSINLRTLEKNEFGGVYEKKSFFFFSIVWIVSILAMIKNFFIITSVWVSKKGLKKFLKGSFRKSIELWHWQKWRIGRSEKHFSSIFFDKFSKHNHIAKVGAAGWRSLKVFYWYDKEIDPYLKNNKEGKLTRFWAQLESMQSVSNRFKIVVDLLSVSIDRINNRHIKLVSVASGSADSVFDAIMRHPKKQFDVTLIDSDKTALEKAMNREGALNLGNARFYFKLVSMKSTINGLDEVCQYEKADIIEMVGLMDYETHKEGVELVDGIRNNLKKGGTFLTGNIRNSPENIFLYWVLLWPKMNHRDPVQLAKILFEGGFKQENTIIYQEPYEVHMISECINV